MPNAAWRLTWALPTLKGPDERIRVAGWYDDVRPPSARDLELLAAMPDEDGRLKETFGLRHCLCGITDAASRRQAVFEPTGTISGLT